MTRGLQEALSEIQEATTTTAHEEVIISKPSTTEQAVDELMSGDFRARKCQTETTASESDVQGKND